MMEKLFIQTGILGAGFSVLLGAFGAHALKSKISDEMLGVFEIGVRYQMYHCLALILLGLMMLSLPSRWLHIAGGSFFIGILLFSGSLYVLSISGIKQWGAVTPVGGVFLLIGWILFAIGTV